VLPEWNRPALAAFPGILPNEPGFATDGSIIWADSEDELPSSHSDHVSGDFSLNAWNSLFPFESNFLSRHGLRSGHAFCYRGKRLQDYADCKGIYVLDMGGYYWSGTLKDPRMWSCVNVAVENGLRVLWAWTAGNAGLSLARLAAAANAFLPPGDRLHVYLFYDFTDTAMEKDVLPLLKESGGVMVPVSNPTGGVYSPFELLQKIKREVHQSVWNETIAQEAYWDITDGWDGCGAIDYRRIFLQAFLRLQPELVVMPLGTGNLLVGSLLAAKDYAELTGRSAPRCVCGVPHDQNVVLQIARAPGFTKSAAQLKESVKLEDRSLTAVLRWTPKVAGYYSALLACIEHAIRQGDVAVFGIDGVRLREAYRAACGPAQVTQPRYIRSEPSSAVAFAALRNLVSVDRSITDRRVLVINTGCGIMGADEVSFLREVIGS
jgi:hypothetical protein